MNAIAASNEATHTLPPGLRDKRSYVVRRFLATRDLIIAARPRRVLDVGCNDGLLLSLVGPGIEKHGIDVIDGPPDPEHGIRYRRHDIAAGLPYDDASFDVVNASEVIEHLHDTLRFLKECHRVLKPGGRVVISTPNLHYWRNLVEWQRGNQFFFVDYHGDQEGHVRYFCPRTLRELADRARFTAIRTRTLGDWGGDSRVLRGLAFLFERLSRDRNLILMMDARKP